MISKLSKGLLRRPLWMGRVSRRPGPVLRAGLVFALVIVIAAVSANAKEPQPLDSKTALIVIDVQAFYFAEGFMPLVNPEAASGNCRKLIFECVLVGDACATRSLEYDDKVIDSADVHNSTLNTLDGNYATVVDTETFIKNY